MRSRPVINHFGSRVLRAVGGGRSHGSHRRTAAVSVFLAFGIQGVYAAQPIFTPLWRTDGISYAADISRDGSTVAGYLSTDFLDRPFYWTAETGTVVLPILPDATYGRFGAISGNGQVFGGFDNVGPIRLLLGGAMQRLSGLPSNPSSTEGTVTGLSDDGSTLVGRTGAAALPYRWTVANGFEELSLLPGTTVIGPAVDVSGDGSVIVGSASGFFNASPRGFRWTEQGGMTQLPMLPGGATARAYAVSGDGSTTVGFAMTPQGRRAAVRWAQDGGIENLGLLPSAVHADAFVVNGDGTAAGGNTDLINRGGPSFIWTIRGGMVDLRAYLVSQGIDLTGFFYLEVKAMSDDGTTIAGTANYWACTGCTIYAVAFRVTGLPSPGCGAADIGRAGGLPGADNALDNNDFIVFIDRFFTGDQRVDIGASGGIPGADGALDNNDFIEFISRFFAGC